MKIKFWKMSGAGNDFILVKDYRCGPAGKARLAKRLCCRKKSIGADGLLFAYPLSPVSLRMEYYNADGSRAFCGNGARCSVLWYSKFKKSSGRFFTLETIKGVLRGEKKSGNRVKMEMPAVSRIELFKKIKPASIFSEIHFADTGVPHAVVPVRNLDLVDVETEGRKLRNHPAFGKAGTNVNFVEVSDKVLKVRTYERGVEGETLACGTGITASGLVLSALKKLSVPVSIISRSGEKFEVNLRFGKKGPEEIYLEGPAELVFSGEIEI